MEEEKLLTRAAAGPDGSIKPAHKDSSSFNYRLQSCEESLEKEPCCLIPFTTGG